MDVVGITPTARSVTNKPHGVAELRERLLGKYRPAEEIFAALGLSERSGYRLLARLRTPWTRVGRRRHFDVDFIQQAMAQEAEGGCAPPRGPGRPRGKRP
jgi:hypothetical protein